MVVTIVNVKMVMLERVLTVVSKQLHLKVYNKKISNHTSKIIQAIQGYDRSIMLYSLM